MCKALRMSAAGIDRMFEEWNKGELDSYLVGIIADMFQHADPRTGKTFIDVILGRISQKETDARMVQSVTEISISTAGIVEAAFAYSLFDSVPEWQAGQGFPAGAEDVSVAGPAAFIGDIRRALYASKTVAYSQGFEFIRKTSEENGWSADLGAMARIWYGGYIIHAILLDRITEAHERDPRLSLLLAGPYFSGEVDKPVEP